MKTSTITNKNQMSYARKGYMGGIPGSKIVRFTMGNTKAVFSSCKTDHKKEWSNSS